MSTLNGIDVSNYQGDFNWPAWRDRIQFAGIRVTEGGALADQEAKANVAGARSIGAVPMGYHFLHAGVPGARQAEFFLSHAKAAGLRAGDLIALDAEDAGLDGGTPARMNGIASDFAAQLRAHFPGYWPFLYTEISLAPAFTSMGSCPLWLANPSQMTVKAAGPWKLVSMEQTGQRGVDTDVFYGDAAQLARLAIPR
jgi:GH25 family lysozyme M1 (1,4-beta-N-acetylmuramidase)